MGIPAYTREQIHLAFLIRTSLDIPGPSYLSGAILRPLLTTSAYLLSNPDLHACSIYLLDGFIYTRLFILLLRQSVPCYRMRYAIAVPAAASLAAASAGWRWVELGRAAGGRSGGVFVAVAVYLGLTVVLMGVRRFWTNAEGEPGRVELEIKDKAGAWDGKNAGHCPAEPTSARPVLSRSSSDSEPEILLETPPELTAYAIGNAYDFTTGPCTITK